jgi:type IV pilus assembly protein PilA
MVAGCLVVNRSAAAGEVQQGVPAAGMPAWAIVLIVLGVLVIPVAILAAIAIPAYQDMTVRSRIHDAVRAGRDATVAVEEFYQKNNVLPRDAAEAGIRSSDPRIVQRVHLDSRTGVVQVVLAIPPLQGKSILFEPRRENDGRVAWTCRSDDVRPQYLPGTCRPVGK